MEILMKKVIIAFTIAVCLFWLLNIILQPSLYQWDLQIYRASVQASWNGLSPYVSQSLTSVADNLRYVKYHYLYPPLTLWFFAPFAFLSYGLSYYLWFALKIFMLITLLILWKTILQKEFNWRFLCFAGLAFSLAVLCDLKSGNISIIEQVLLWSAFICYIKNKYRWFCVLILVASMFKMIPLAFLGLLIFTDSPKKYKYLLFSGMAFAAYLLLNYIVYPNYTMQFLSLSGVSAESMTSGVGDTSLYALLGGSWLYILFALLIGVSTILVLRRSPDKLSMICLCCLAYALIVPRFKDYSMVLLIVPAFLFIRYYFKNWGMVLALFCVASNLSRTAPVICALLLLSYVVYVNILWQNKNRCRG
jgi:hypothetical protein